MKDLIMCAFMGHRWEIVIISKKYDKCLRVCRKCGISWWNRPEKEFVGDSEYLQQKEMK